MQFETQFRKPERFLSNPGSPVKILYGPEFDDKGRMNLVEKGRENLYDFIQSFKESVDIHVLLKRFASGETDVLSKIQGFYGDFSEFPRTYADLLNTVNEGEAFFNGLPVEVRSKFGHSFPVFMAALSDGSLSDILSEYFGSNDQVKDKEPPAEPEVSE